MKTCPVCNETFYKPHGYGKRQWDERKFCCRKCGATKRKVPDETIVRLYVADRMSTSEIGTKYGLSGTHVGRILKANKVKIRDSKENKKLSQNRPDVKEKIRKSSTGRRLSDAAKNKLRELVGPKNKKWKGGITTSSQGYCVFTNSRENGPYAGKSVHIAVAERKYGRPLKNGEHVHHVDKSKTNNDPDNLVIMTATDHAKLHTGDRENGKLKSV